jgi:signal transduction histidine kinase
MSAPANGSRLLPSSAAPQARKGARWVGLQDKLLLANVMLIVATLLFCGATFASHNAHQVRLLKHEEVRHIASAVAIAAVAPLAQADTPALSELSRRLLAVEDLTSVTFYDARGVPLVAWKETDQGAQELDVSRVPVAYTANDSREKEAAEAGEVSLFIAIRPPGGQRAEQAPLGFVALTVSQAPALAYMQGTVRLITGGGLAILAMVLPLVFLLIQRAFAPIRRLAIAARNVAAGRFETVDIARGDALGLLAETFNHMVMGLAEQKQRADEAHKSLLEANQHLEAKIAERTAAIEAASGRLAAEIAEKEDFLRAVSHDLNAPLRNIDGMATMLLQKHSAELPQEVVDRLDRIKKNVEHETSLINELLELSRIKTRREQPEPVNMEELLWQLRGVFENDLRQHQIDLVIESRLPTLHAERARIRQVFQNLIDNAIKYMGPGPERKITIGARIGRSETEFWVRDTGLGIAPEDIGRIFFVFRRGKNQQGVAGKGVGLASVKSIIENYNGRIWVESTPGQGSYFRFTINARFVAAEGPVFSSSRGPAAAPDAGSETRAA